MADMSVQIQQDKARGEAVHVGLGSINQEFKEREVEERSRGLGLGYINLLETQINPDILNLIPKDISIVAEIIPFFRVGKKIRVALVNENNEKTKEVIKLLERRFEIDQNLCSVDSLTFAQKNYEKKFYREEEEVRAWVEEDGEISLEEELKRAKEIPVKMREMKSDRALNLIHEIVLKLHISDIHFQPVEADRIVIRGRLDGVLRDIFSIDAALNDFLVRQIKHDALLKYNITNVPQDGKYSFLAADRAIDVRVSTFPTNFGESVVLRFLDSKKGIVPLKKLGFSQSTLTLFEKYIAGAGGMILVTGPTGSGKTTTLYSALAEINSPEKKIATLEDPIEFRLPGVLQSGVNPDAGFDFQAGLRAMLRQDPDVILIGEIRDRETAETAVQSALTGHVVFSTLHTNSAADAIPRLINMDIKPFVLAPALRVIVAQRLVRKICTNCKKSQAITDEERMEILETQENLQHRGTHINIPNELSVGTGCEKCAGTGFRGEMGVIELLPIDEKISKLFFGDFSAQNISSVARQNGMLTMWEEGIFKVVAGETTIGELRRRIEKS